MCKTLDEEVNELAVWMVFKAVAIGVLRYLHKLCLMGL